MSVVASLCELEERGYLRRVVWRDPVTRQYSTVCEVFERPYESTSPTGEMQKVRPVAAWKAEKGTSLTVTTRTP
ncbi:hypothetical protein ACFY6U_49945 [Streptomyces sp. NPDC013157]|uniref:hypothetical protein n=1 Tax=Streptomyces sp. NPDC013157 TaxID=3364861 RepID=UPI0036A1A619